MGKSELDAGAAGSVRVSSGLGFSWDLSGAVKSAPYRHRPFRDILRVMSRRLSAGLLVYRISQNAEEALEVLIVHPGGPFWARKDSGAWSIPKGEYEEDESAQTAACREFREEIGLPVPPGDLVELGSLRQPGGKVVTTFAVAGDVDLTTFRSNTFELEWPKGSGRMLEFPEVDRAKWVELSDARVKLHKGQVPFLDRLVEQLKKRAPEQ